jgi:hypothetical protein
MLGDWNSGLFSTLWNAISGIIIIGGFIGFGWSAYKLKKGK